MSVALGVIALIFFSLTFIGSISFYLKGDILKARHADIECIGWFIAACICFK